MAPRPPTPVPPWVDRPLYLHSCLTQKNEIQGSPDCTAPMQSGAGPTLYQYAIPAMHSRSTSGLLTYDPSRCCHKTQAPQCWQVMAATTRYPRRKCDHALESLFVSLLLCSELLLAMVRSALPYR